MELSDQLQATMAIPQGMCVCVYIYYKSKNTI